MTTNFPKVVGSNPGAVYWMDIFEDKKNKKGIEIIIKKEKGCVAKNVKN